MTCKRCISTASLASFSLRCAVFAASASDGSCRSAVSSWLRYRATLSSICARRRCAREVLVPVVDRLELAAVDRDARLRQQADRAAKRHELRAYLADRRPVILAEIGNRLVIRNKPTGEPHDFNVTTRLTLKPAARLNAVEITVDVELEQHRRMIRWTAGDLGLNPVEPQIGQIEPVDKNV